MPAPYDTNAGGLELNVLLAVENSLLLLVGSPSLNKIIVFEYEITRWTRNVPKEFDLPQPPIKFLNLGGRNIMILYKDTQGPQIYETR